MHSAKDPNPREQKKREQCEEETRASRRREKKKRKHVCERTRLIAEVKDSAANELTNIKVMDAADDARKNYGGMS